MGKQSSKKKSKDSGIIRDILLYGSEILQSDYFHKAALGHDLGMVGREDKYEDKVAAWKSHPKESARIMKELIPDLSPEAEEVILSHMWPLAGSRPSSKEGRLLCMADKYASMADWRTWLTRKEFAKKIKERLEV